MIQNVSQNRTDKKITKEDLDRIFKASHMAVFPCVEQKMKDMVSNDGKTWMTPVVVLFEGTGDNKCKINWFCCLDITSNFTTLSYVSRSSWIIDTAACSLWYKGYQRIGEEQDSKNFYPDLKIQKGEIKVVVETNLLRRYGETIKQMFGFYLINPKPIGISYGHEPYFHNYVIFSPRPGIFDPTTPPQ